MRNYRISNEAKDDLRRIYLYGVEKFGEQLADKYYYDFFDLFEKLTKTPYLYQSVDYLRTGYRRAICGSDTVYYRVNESYVEIMAVLGGQDTDIWL